MDEVTTPQHEGQIGMLAPIEPNSNPKDEKQKQSAKFQIDEDLHKFFLNLWSKCEKLNEQDWLSVKRQMVKARKYFDGKQYGYVTDSCEWVDYDKRPGEVNYRSNVYQAHLQTALTEISKGITELSFSHIAPESWRGQQIAKVAEARYRTHRRKTLDALKYQHENLSLLMNGLASRYTYFEWKDGKEQIPVFGDKTTSEGASATVCAVCYAPRDEAESMTENQVESANPALEQNETDADGCQNCGSNAVKVIQSGAIKTRAVEGYETAKTGENKWVSVDPLGLVFYLHAPTVADTPYIIWKQVILSDVLQSQYPDIPLTEGVRSMELKYKQAHETGVPNQQTTWLREMQGSNTADKAVSEFEQGWFDVELYKNRKTTSDITLRNGTTVPKGTKLGDAFPNGLYLAKNDKKILDVWSEDKNDKWTIAPYVTRLGTMVGAGTTVAIDQQDIKNDLLNLKMASVFNDAFAKEFVNEQYIDPQNIPNNPSERAVVANLPDGARIVGTAIDRLPPSQLSPEVYQIDEQNGADMQMGLGTFTGSQAAAPDLQAVKNTASGFMAWREMTIGRYAPMLAVRADALDRQQAMQFLLNDQKFLTPEQWSLVKGDYGADAVKAFLECDLREELVIEVVHESYMPSSAAVDQANMVGYGQFIAETGLDPNSEMGAYAAEQFRIPKHLVGFDAQYSTAQSWIEQFGVIASAIIKQFGDVETFLLDNPRTAQLAQLVTSQANCPVEAEMDNLEAMQDSLKDWWGKDTGRGAPNLLKASVLFRNEEIKAALVKREQEKLQMQMEAQAPMMQQQQEQMANQQQMQNAQANAQSESENQRQAQETERQNAQLADNQANREQADGHKVLDLVNEQAQREHEAELAQKQQK